MDPGSALIKTSQGRLEMARRSSALTPVERRLLILVDGKKTVNDLAAFVRVGELEAALERLLALGLAAPTGQVVALQPPVGPGFACASAAQAERAATGAQEFARVRDEASRFVRERLGSAGEPMCSAIDRCNGPHQLRSMLRGVETFVGERLDAQTTQAFARHFGALLL